MANGRRQEEKSTMKNEDNLDNLVEKRGRAGR